MVRGLRRVALLGVVAGFGLVGEVGAQNLSSGSRVLARAELSVRARLPEVVLLRDQVVVSDQHIDGQREVVISVRVGGNVALRLEAVPLAAESGAARVLDARGAWLELDRPIIVAHEARGGLREVRMRVRVSDDAVLPALRAVADR